MIKIYTNILKIQLKISQVKSFWNLQKKLHQEWVQFIPLELFIEISKRFLSFSFSFSFSFLFLFFFFFSFSFSFSFLFFLYLIIESNQKTRSNILLETKNHKMNAIICDFGLARMSSEMNVISFSFRFPFVFSFLFFSFLFFSFLFFFFLSFPFLYLHLNDKNK